MIIVACVVLFMILSFIAAIKLAFTSKFYEKLAMLFYTTSNITMFILTYIIYSNKFNSVIATIFPLIVINMISTLAFINSKITEDSYESD